MCDFRRSTQPSRQECNLYRPANVSVVAILTRLLDTARFADRVTSFSFH